jgi:hypothetical protein
MIDTLRRGAKPLRILPDSGTFGDQRPFAHHLARSPTNPSLSRVEPVCGTPKRKLEIGDQRLTPEIHRSRPENLELLTRGSGASA